MSQWKREDIMLPNATSTPTSMCSRRTIMNNFVEKGPNLSPIIERNASITARQTSSMKGHSSYHLMTRISESSRFSSRKFAPLVVMNSESEDSEEEMEFVSTRRSKVDGRKSKFARSQEERRDQKKDDQEVLSGVEANLNKSKMKPTAKIRPMSNKSLDAFVKQVARNRGISVQPLSRVPSKQLNRPLTKLVGDESKENILGKINDVDLLLVKKRKRSLKRGLAPIEQNTMDNHPAQKKKKLDTEGSDSKKMVETASEKEKNEFPEICMPKDFEWKDSGLEGISTFKYSSVVYVRINPKCKFTSCSLSKHKLFIVTEGNGLVTLNSKKTKVGPGATLKVTSECDIMNTGFSKSLILVGVKE